MESSQGIPGALTTTTNNHNLCYIMMQHTRTWNAQHTFIVLQKANVIRQVTIDTGRNDPLKPKAGTSEATRLRQQSPCSLITSLKTQVNMFTNNQVPCTCNFQTCAYFVRRFFFFSFVFF